MTMAGLDVSVDACKLLGMTPEQLKSLREALGWTQDQMADYLGLRHRSQVHRLEIGATKIWGAKLKMLELLQAETRQKKSHR
jgi:transcriptional regulator with XRE-family HTH domain